MAVDKKTDPSRRGWPIFALGVLFGLGLLAVFVVQAYRDIRIGWFYKPTTCSVISSSIHTITTMYTRVHRDDVTRTTMHPQVTYQLQLGGRWYTAIGFDNMKGWMSRPSEIDGFEPGHSYA